jgi:hypothetical protein
MLVPKNNPPSPDILMDSMRSIGYSFESALADVLDNSITAEAKHIWIELPATDKLLYLSMLDDGCGMDKDTLFNAMKYGSQSCHNSRTTNDLGRFGLGLKSASLSQCRKLIVASKKDDVLSAYCWDLDYVIERKEWDLLEYQQEDLDHIPGINKLIALNSGTLVIWEEFDVLEKSSSGQTFLELTKRIEESSKVIALIFHNFLSDSRKPLFISINNNPIKPLDPFLDTSNNPHKTVRRDSVLTMKDEKGNTQLIKVQPVVLPYFQDLTQEDKEKIAFGTNLCKQGFYIYRNNRLIVWGTWFGLKPTNELAKYARIRVDIPSSLDQEWSIDVKKQNAVLPMIIKSQLRAKVDDAFNISMRQSSKRSVIRNGDQNSIWTKHENRSGNYTYSVNKESPLYTLLKNSVSEEDLEKFDDFLDIFVKSIPYQDIYVDKANEKIAGVEDDETIDKGKILLTVQELIKMKMKNDGCSFDLAFNTIISMDPFSQFDFLKKELAGGNGNDK